MILITHIHMNSPTSTHHQHIAEVKWKNPENSETGASSVPTLVDWIDNKGGIAKVNDGRRTVDVAVVHSNPAYLRTIADGVYTDNLLALPRY
jgi:hypothetical protein